MAAAREYLVSHFFNRLTLVAVGIAMAPAVSCACATCGCTLNADAALGYLSQPGFRLSFEYDYIHQDQLRSGRDRVSTVPEGSELERETLNRYLTLGLDYSPMADWNFNLRVPYVIRTHSTYGEYDGTEPLPPTSGSRSSSIGDIKLIGNYQGFLEGHNLGIQLGVKLPTGNYGTDVKFSSGPAAGDPLDASLQPGTGSTDIIVGVYYYRYLSENMSAFANVQFQTAVAEKQNAPGNDFRPGNSTTASIGLRYEGDPRWVPQLQLNYTHKSVDQGALADSADTPGDVLYVSPGLIAQVYGNLHAYGFVQLPVYSDLVGYQVFPRYTFSVGASYAF